MTGKDYSPITWKQLTTIMSGILLAITLVGFVHAKVIIPSVINEVRVIIDEEISKHASGGPHPGAIGEIQWTFVREDLKDLELSLKEGFKGVEERLRALEAK